MSVFQFGETPLNRQRYSIEDAGYFSGHPRQHERAECGFHHLGGIFSIFQFLSVSLSPDESVTLVINRAGLKIRF